VIDAKLAGGGFILTKRSQRSLIKGLKPLFNSSQAAPVKTMLENLDNGCDIAVDTAEFSNRGTVGP